MPTISGLEKVSADGERHNIQCRRTTIGVRQQARWRCVWTLDPALNTVAGMPLLLWSICRSADRRRIINCAVEALPRRREHLNAPPWPKDGVRQERPILIARPLWRAASLDDSFHGVR
jgi:hypothetical protein